MNLAEPLFNKEQTGRRMRALVGRYASDLDKLRVRYNGRSVPLSSLPLTHYHKLIREIPYKRDRSPVEVVGRPARLLGGELRALDCKKKAVCIASWAQRHGVPWRFIASSRRRDGKAHHVFPQLRMGGEWVNCDATYRHMRIGQVKRVTAAEVI